MPYLNVRPGCKRHSSPRRGAALVVLLVCLIPLVAFLALSIDLGLLAVARTQCQDAADAAAMAGVRTLNGINAKGVNNNYASVQPNAEVVAKRASVLSTNVQRDDLRLQIGRYVYDPLDRRFEGQFPGPAKENWTLVQATVGVDVGKSMAFSKALGLSVPKMQASATAVHRPRDVAIILDYSGSMRFASLLGAPYYGNRESNNPDPVIPTFGAYSATGSAALQATSFDLPYVAANVTATTSDGRPPIVEDFYTDDRGTRAFAPAPVSYGAIPGGDNCLTTNRNTGAGYAQTVAQVLNLGSVSGSTRDATFETTGYRAYGMTAAFQRYSAGPGYWGKTFFNWPPDPSNGPDGTTNDWRKRYFTYPGSAARMDDNGRLWDSSGNWRAPGSTSHQIDYAAILSFIKNVGPNPFPSRLQSGRILYYDRIPDAINTGSNPPADLNERFWKDYIDYVLGVIHQPNGSWDVVCGGSQGDVGYGADYVWGSVRITSKSGLSGSPPPYMHYLDNPRRPKLHFWFGPLSMVDFLGCYNVWGQVSPYGSRFCWWPGTCHESPMYGCKLGIRAALTDSSKNHPNDLVSLIMFSAPRDSAKDQSGRFNRARVGMSRDFALMQEALWYPPATLGNPNATVRPYDADNVEIPRAYGGTCYAMPLMLAYNQFSANPALLSFNPGAAAGDAGGNGRRGAQKIVIFETDGAPNTTASAPLANAGPQESFFRVRYNSATPGAGEFPNDVKGHSDNSPAVTNQIFKLCETLCADETANPSGYSQGSKRVQIHCIGFGPEFDPSNSRRSTNVATLNRMQQISGVNDNMPDFKLIYGNEKSVVNKLQQAFTNIMQSGIHVSLIK